MADRIPIPTLASFATACFAAVGLEPRAAATAAGVLVSTDTLGVFTHGTKLLGGYLRRLKGGGYRAAAVPRVEREGPAWAIVDGDAGLGQIGCTAAIEVAIAKARRCGVAFVAVRDTGHIGAAGHYALLAARAGCAAMVTGNDVPSVAVPGARGAVLGSNPLAFAIPTGRDPILLDIATAAVAGGKVYAAVQRGEPIPPTWLIGPDGLPTTDGSLYPHAAALAPMAGHKGYGIGLWCEVLSALVPGGRMTREVGSWMFDPPSEPSGHNASMTVIHVEGIADPARFQSRVQALVAEIHGAPAAAGSAGVLVPGEREFQLAREAERAGIALPDDVRAKLREAGELAGVPPPPEL